MHLEQTDIARLALVLTQTLRLFPTPADGQTHINRLVADRVPTWDWRDHATAEEVEPVIWALRYCAAVWELVFDHPDPEEISHRTLVTAGLLRRGAHVTANRFTSNEFQVEYETPHALIAVGIVHLALINDAVKQEMKKHFRSQYLYSEFEDSVLWLASYMRAEIPGQLDMLGPTGDTDQNSTGE